MFPSNTNVVGCNTFVYVVHFCEHIDLVRCCIESESPRELSLVIELKGDTKQNSNEAIGIATYSNSESTVLSYESIFETLWIQSKIAAVNNSTC